MVNPPKEDPLGIFSKRPKSEPGVLFGRGVLQRHELTRHRPHTHTPALSTGAGGSSANRTVRRAACTMPCISAASTRFWDSFRRPVTSGVAASASPVAAVRRVRGASMPLHQELPEPDPARSTTAYAILCRQGVQHRRRQMTKLATKKAGPHLGAGEVGRPTSPAPA